MKHEKLIAICEGALCVALAYALSLLELDLWYQGGSIGLCMLPLATVNKAAFIFMQALGRPVESAGLSFFREVLLAVPLVMLLPRAFGLMGVLYSMPAADILTFLASLYVLLRTDRQLRAAPGAQKA